MAFKLLDKAGRRLFKHLSIPKKVQIAGGHILEENLSEKQQQKILQNHSLTNSKDLAHCILLVFVTLISWIVPEKGWKFFTAPLAMMQFFVCHKVAQSRIHTIRKICGDRIKTPSPRKIEIARMASLFEARLQYMREYRPGGWKPHFHIHGKKHVEKSLQNGHGAILWIAPFHFNELAVKKGLAQHGFDLTQLSVYWHGISKTRFGLKFLNPIWIKAENKYLHERVVIQPDGQFGYLRTIEKKLRKSALVAISCIPLEGQKAIQQKILNGTFPIAPGAASMALTTKADLLPVFLLQKSPGEFDIIIEAPIDIPPKKNRHIIIDIIIEDFSKLIEGYVIEKPTAFRYWDREKNLELL